MKSHESELKFLLHLHNNSPYFRPPEWTQAPFSTQLSGSQTAAAHLAVRSPRPRNSKNAGGAARCGAALGELAALLHSRQYVLAGSS
jgi:hypothetical protein